MHNEVKIYAVDDNEDWLDSIQWLFKSVGKEVEVFNSAQLFFEQYDPAQAGCLILDVRIPGMSGLQLQKALEGRDRNLRIIFLSGHATVSTAVSAMKAGAVDFLEKPVDDQVLLDKVQEVQDELMHNLERIGRTADLEQRLKALTIREQEVLQQLLAGHSSKVIAQNLHVSTRTIETHRGNILSKTGVPSVVELLAKVKNLP